MIISRREQLVQESATHGKIAVIVDQSWAVITTISAYRVACTSPRRLGHVAQFFLGAGYPKNLFIFVLFCSASLPPALISVFQAESVEYRQPKNGEIALWSNMRVVKCKYGRRQRGATHRSSRASSVWVRILEFISELYTGRRQVKAHGSAVCLPNWLTWAKCLSKSWCRALKRMPHTTRDAHHHTVLFWVDIYNWITWSSKMKDTMIVRTRRG